MPTTNAELYWRVAVPAPPVPHHLVGQDDEVLGLLTPVDDDRPELVMVDAPSHRSQGFGRLAALCRSARFISWTRVPSDTGGWPGIGRLSASQRIENPSLPWNHQEPLCGTPFPQVTPDRRGQSYRFSFSEVMRSLSSHALIVADASDNPAGDHKPGRLPTHPGIYLYSRPTTTLPHISISTAHLLHQPTYPPSLTTFPGPSNSKQEGSTTKRPPPWCSLTQARPHAVQAQSGAPNASVVATKAPGRCLAARRRPSLNRGPC